MFRILTSSKDTYITDKIIFGSRSLYSNVGQAASLDLYKMYNETTLSGSATPIELSRALIKFDYASLQSLTSSLLDPSGANFEVYLRLKNVYGGQTVPSNFTLQLNPLAKDWDEGIGSDIMYFKDLDATNWMTASSNPVMTLWTVSGASSPGNIGDVCDYYVSGNIGHGSQSLTVTQSFARGDEDLFMDISQMVSASIWGNLPNNGFRISFLDAQETDATTRFVKRFGARNTNSPAFRPQIYVKYDGNVVSDDSNMAMFDENNRFFIYNGPRGINQNFRSGSQPVTGANSLILELIASKSQIVPAVTWSQSHSQSITYYTSSVTYFSTAVTASQLSFGNLKQTGSYFADVRLSPDSTASLDAFVSGNNYNQSFMLLWKTLDRTVLLASGGYVKFDKFAGNGSSFDQRNYVINITNLEQFYTNKEHTRLRVFIQDWEFDFATQRLPKPSISRIFKNMYWRVIDPFTKEIIIPFDTVGTKMSSDAYGMFYDFWFNDLEPSRVYEFEFKLEENGRTDFFFEQGFRFKVVNE